MDAYDDLAAREPGFFDGLKNAALAFPSFYIANPLNPIL